MYAKNTDTEVITSTNSIPYSDIGNGVTITVNSKFWNLSPEEKIAALDKARSIYADLKTVDYVNWVIGNSETPERAAREIGGIVDAEQLRSFLSGPFADDLPDLRDFTETALTIFEVVGQKQKVKRAATGTLRKQVINRDKWQCRYCGTILENRDIHIDHVIPYSLGGLTELDNLVVACPDCNLKKSGRTLEEAHLELIQL